MLFFGGAAALVLSMLWWGAVLLSRLGILPTLPSQGLVPIWMHAWLMVYGIFPFFVLGFLFTAFPRWIGAPPVPLRVYQPVALALFTGYLLVLFGAPFSGAAAAAGMAVTALAWIGGVATLGLRLKQHPPAGSPHPPWVVVLLLAGLLGAVLSAYGAASGNTWALISGPRLGIWGFLAPMVFVISHRMISFFAQGAIAGYTAFRPGWAPAVAAALFLAHAGLLLAGLPAWLWLVDIPLAGLGGWLLWRWQPWTTRGNALVWTLFAAYFWLPAALGLSAIQSLVLAFGNAFILGLGPLHLLTVGLLTSMLMAMATRVSLGHSGRPLRMGRFAVLCFVLLQFAVVTRFIAAVPDRPMGMQVWLVITAGLWLLAWGPWALRFGLIYWQPRVDE